MFGDDGVNEDKKQQQRGRNYQSWQYYQSDFGIYDDDEEIVTLDARDFHQNVLHGHSVWFINYYSPRLELCTKIKQYFSDPSQNHVENTKSLTLFTS